MSPKRGNNEQTIDELTAKRIDDVVNVASELLEALPELFEPGPSYSGLMLGSDAATDRRP